MLAVRTFFCIGNICPGIGKSSHVENNRTESEYELGQSLFGRKSLDDIGNELSEMLSNNHANDYFNDQSSDDDLHPNSMIFPDGGNNLATT